LATAGGGTRAAGEASVLRDIALLIVLASGCTAPIELPDVAYDPRSGSSTTMDLYLPDDGAATHPTVMFIHGGGWKAGDKDHARNLGPRLARSGYVVASINYRLLPGGVFPNNLADCTCALAYLRAHAEEYAIDPDRIAVMGYSAGAHLASLVGLASEHPELPADCEVAGAQRVAPPAAVISASGPQDMRTFWDDAGDKSGIEAIFGGSPAELARAYDLGSPRHHVRPGAPPFLLIGDAIDFGGIDDMRDSLVETGNDARLLRIAGSLHILVQHGDPGVYEGGMASEAPEAWIAIADFLDRTIGGGS
jgi:acetyl esterase/lipase